MRTNMSDEDIKEFQEMKEFFRRVKYGSIVAIAIFSVCMALGGAYLLAKNIINK